MHCNARTMAKVALILGGLLAAAAVALPEARDMLLAGAPLLLSLVCPISMIAMALMMRRSPEQARAARDSTGNASASGHPPAAAQPASCCGRSGSQQHA